jgi:hypothetical protein
MSADDRIIPGDVSADQPVQGHAALSGSLLAQSGPLRH